VLPAPPLSFDRVADEYERTRFLPQSVAHAVAERMLRDIDSEAWLLDAGVGTGRYARALAERHPRRVAGVDVSRAMMERLDAVPAGGPHLVQADLRALPFADGAFGGALAVHIFHLIANWPRALDEIWRVLRPGASLWLAKEDEGDLRVRGFYLKRAAEAGVLPPNPGARTHEVSLALAGRGAQVREVDGGAESSAETPFCWERAWTGREMLDLLARRTYSVLWDIPEPAHRTLLAETRAWTLRTFGSLDVADRAVTRLTLFEARKAL